MIAEAMAQSLCKLEEVAEEEMIAEAVAQSLHKSE